MANEFENPYEAEGFKNREEYLVDLAGQFDVDTSIVFALADMLGENEDFDGLITELEDYQEMGMI